MNRRFLTALRVILTVLCVLTAGFIFFNSSQNADDSEIRSGAVLESLNSMLRALGIGVELSEHTVRKLAHFTEYFVYGGLLSGAVYSYALNIKGLLLTALPLGLCTAVVDELIQLMSDGRSCQFSDVILDFSAVLTAVLIMTLILCLIGKKRNRKERDLYE